MTDALTLYFRCPAELLFFEPQSSISGLAGYFTCGDNICFGKYAGTVSDAFKYGLSDARGETVIENGAVKLPFDPDEVFQNLTQEKYADANVANLDSILNRAYYLVRPTLPVAARKHLQKLRLNNWRSIPFPRWPVDTTVDDLMADLLLPAMRARQIDRLPFIWFWPNGASSAAMVTHDVETIQGRDSSARLMDIDDSFCFKSSFQVVPEHRYPVPDSYLAEIKGRGFELAVQDLNHDGRLFLNRSGFLKRAAKINEYGRHWHAEGFRAAILYRRQEWFDALDFKYDMSVPNVAHLDPQRGGCCTVMPYFVGRMLELPVTTTQDYTLFHILKSHSIDLWKQQLGLIMRRHGLASFIVHPDYIAGAAEQKTYAALLDHLCELRHTQNLWMAKPGEVNRWWRRRAQMRIVDGRDGWCIEGDGSEDARIAYAFEEDGRIKFEIESPVKTVRKRAAQAMRSYASPDVKASDSA